LKDNEQAGQEIIIIPNPVNNNAVIRFHLASGNHVNLSLYDTQGRFVRTFIDKNLQAGTYEVPVNAGELRNNMVSGVYFVELQTHESFQSAKLILAE
jgi:hypothetical protein